MINCFHIDAYTEHEHGILKPYPKPYEVLCTKKPSDIKRVSFPLEVNQDLFVIYMLRDPRDCITSRSHKNNTSTKKIWGNLDEWRSNQRIASRLARNNRFITIKYEDLVSDPDKVQVNLQHRLPFLVPKSKFSQFHQIASPSEKSVAALGEIRPVSSASVGKWNHNKAFVKAQIEKYGSISQELINLGYELNTDWELALGAVDADNSDQPIKRKSILGKIWRTLLLYPFRYLRYWLKSSTVTTSIFNRLLVL